MTLNNNILKKLNDFDLRCLLLFAMLPAFFNPATAQNQEVTIIAPYRPTLSAAQKLPLNPVLSDTVAEIPDVTFSISSSPVFTSYTTEKVKPALIDVETGEILRRNYLKAGFGNYTTPYFELYTNNLRSKKYAIGFRAQHHSSQGQIEDYANSTFSHNQAGLHFRRYLDEKIISGDIYYQRDVVHYYGFKPADFPNDTISGDDLRQRYSLFGLDAMLSGNQRHNSKLNYRAGLRFYHLSDLFESSELNIGLSSNVNTKNDILDFSNKEELGADFTFDFYQNNDSLQSNSTLMLSLKPYLQMNFGFLDVTLGAGLALASESETSLYVFPNIKASYEVIPDYLRFYVAATGGLHRNSFRSVISENPWIDNMFPFGFSATKYDLKGGVTGKINMFLDYNFNVSWSETDNMLFYVNHYPLFILPPNTGIDGNKFTGLYDTATVTAINFEVGYQPDRIFKAMLRGTYRSYQLENQEKPWHKPALELTLTGEYLLTEKISVGGDIFYYSKTYAPVIEQWSPAIAEINGYVDLNLNAEYRFNDQISAFVQINNALTTRYYRYYNYPSQRINALGGFIFSF